MKIKWMFVAVFCIAAASLHAQEMVNDYWVVEGNLNQPRSYVIHYYNNQHQQIGEERWEGRPLDISKKKTVRYLNRRLKEVASRDSLVRQNQKEKKHRR